MLVQVLREQAKQFRLDGGSICPPFCKSEHDLRWLLSVTYYSRAKAYCLPGSRYKQGWWMIDDWSSMWRISSYRPWYLMSEGMQGAQNPYRDQDAVFEEAIPWLRFIVLKVLVQNRWPGVFRDLLWHTMECLSCSISSIISGYT